jgi:hypothetical protein
MGCSSTYTINDFPSKEKFHQSFNNFAKNKDINVILTNDSSFTLRQGAELINDTLFSVFSLGIRYDKSLSLFDLKNLDYTSNDYKSANILTENGQRFNAENIIIHNDSISFSLIVPEQTTNNIIPLSKIKTISYKNRFLRIPLGILSGGMSGFLAGILYVTNNKFSKDEYGYSTGAPVIYAILGAAFGGIASIIIGYDYNYYFNP